MTTYLAAYDVEHPDCLAALRSIVRVHEKHNMPGTCFIVAQLLDRQGAEYRALLGGHPLFEIACHSYTHMLLRDHPLCGKAGPKEQHEREVVASKKRIEDHFACAVEGFRAPVSFEDGLAGDPDLLRLCERAGYGYTSCLAWAPGCKLPALIRDPFSYAAQGHPGLWEVPPCGWHDNVMKKGNCSFGPIPVQLSPHPYPEIELTGYIESPEAEAALDAKLINRAVRMNARHVLLVWHPWSLGRFDPEMSMVDHVFCHVRDCDLAVATLAQYVDALRAG